jgi:hypothetical protein
MKIYYSLITIILLVSSTSNMASDKKSDKKVTFFNKLDEHKTADELGDFEHFHAIQKTQYQAYKHFSTQKDRIERRRAITEIHCYFEPTPDGKLEQKNYKFDYEKQRCSSCKLIEQNKHACDAMYIFMLRKIVNGIKISTVEHENKARQLDLYFEDYNELLQCITLKQLKTVALGAIKDEAQEQANKAVTNALENIQFSTAQKNTSTKQNSFKIKSQRFLRQRSYNNEHSHKCCHIS